MSLPSTVLVIVSGPRQKYTERISYYVINSRYMLNIRPKLFENESSVHLPLRFIHDYSIYQDLMM